MSKVDVLAWLDAKVERELEIERATGLPNNARKPAIAVRVAVAELIKAAEFELRQLNGSAAYMSMGDRAQRLRTALANIGSAS